MAVNRNDPCPCGSGAKYKRCCERQERNPLTPAAIVLMLVVVGGGAVAVMALMQAPEPGNTAQRVWSEEHKHWHTVGGGEKGTAPGVPVPGGPIPAGGLPDAAAPKTPVPQPPGPAPAGKVWSAEHGHWHDAP